MKKRVVTHKFHAKPERVDDIYFASKLEAKYYQKLKLLRASGELLFFLRQVPIDILGGVKYVVDFVEFWKDGRVIFTDVKGVETRQFIDKKKMVEELYPIELNVVKSV